MSIVVQGVGKRFGAFEALRDVSLQVDGGELVALLGPSGCGKTTLLRIIAGLESADSGRVLFEGEDVTGVHVRERRVGFVFQHYALFRHLSVADNIAFGLRMLPRAERPAEAQVAARVRELLELVQLDGLGARHPAQLSGGQRQRVALARALAVRPRVLLLDEPFGALDAKVRKELRRWLRELHHELAVTSVFVTHDQDEALDVAHRVVLMNGGRIEQSGTPEQVWLSPATSFVHGFLGDVNRLGGDVRDGLLHLGGASWRVPAGASLAPDATRAEAFVRPEDLQVQRYSPGAADDAQGQTVGLVVQLARARVFGPLARLELVREAADDAAQGTVAPLEAHLSADEFRSLGLREGETLVVTPRRLAVYPLAA